MDKVIPSFVVPWWDDARDICALDFLDEEAANLGEAIVGDFVGEALVSVNLAKDILGLCLADKRDVGLEICCLGDFIDTDSSLETTLGDVTIGYRTFSDLAD